MRAKILVTGALGNVGAEVVKQLQARGQAVRASHRAVQPVRERLGGDVEVVWLDFSKPESFAAAFRDVERMFLMRPPAISDVKHSIFPAIDAARRAGVQQIVFLSLLGAERNPIVPHHKIERYLMACGLDYTFLRASFFMQNLNTTHQAEIRDRDEIFVPAGAGKTSFIDVRDIAAVAAMALTEDVHANRAYDLTGAQALSYYQAADMFTEVLGRKIRYQSPSLLRFIRKQRASGAALPFVLVMAGIYTTAWLGWAGRITNDVRQLLQRAPIAFRQYVEDYQACWRPG